MATFYFHTKDEGKKIVNITIQPSSQEVNINI